MPKHYINDSCSDLWLIRTAQAADIAFSAAAGSPDRDKNSIRQRLSRPERMGSFQIPWVDDTGSVRLSMGYYAAYPRLPGERPGSRYRPGVP